MDRWLGRHLSEWVGMGDVGEWVCGQKVVYVSEWVEGYVVWYVGECVCM